SNAMLSPEARTPLPLCPRRSRVRKNVEPQASPQPASNRYHQSIQPRIDFALGCGMTPQPEQYAKPTHDQTVPHSSLDLRKSEHERTDDQPKSQNDINPAESAVARRQNNPHYCEKCHRDADSHAVCER